MGKHIVIIEGSPRVAKNTDRIVGAFLCGAQEAGHTTYKLSLAKNRINGCVHCMQCGKNGYCVQKDAMEAFYPELERADLVVFASPIYFWQISSQMKAAIDRLYALYTMGRLPRGDAGKDMMTFLVCGDADPAAAADAQAFFSGVFEKRLGWKNVGTLVVSGTSRPDFDLEKEGYLQKAHDLGAGI